MNHRHRYPLHSAIRDTLRQVIHHHTTLPTIGLIVVAVAAVLAAALWLVWFAGQIFGGGS